MLAGRGAIAAQKIEVHLKAGPDVIEQSTSEKLQGGKIHFTGRWNQMVKNGSSSIISQLAGRLSGLKKLQQADFKSKLAVATAVIKSKIQYLLPLYGGAPDYLMRAIQVQQLKAARFVCGYNSFYWSTHKLLKTCGRLSIKQQKFDSSTLLAHKIVITSLPRNLWADIVQQHTVQTRAATQGQIRYSNNYRGASEFSRSSFKYRAQRYYNRIPADLKRQSLKVFRSSLKLYAARNIHIK